MSDFVLLVLLLSGTIGVLAGVTSLILNAIEKYMEERDRIWESWS